MKDVFVGRQTELAYLRDRLEEARRGVSRIAFVEGDSGIGKTALLRQFLEGAENAHVFSATGEELETGLAFGIVEQLFHGIGLPDGRLSVSPWTQPNRADVLAVGVEITDMFGKLRGHGVIVVAVDDAQWADLSSLQSLTFVLRRLRMHQVLTVIVTRDSAVLPSSLHRLLTTGSGERLRLHGLSAPEIRVLAAKMGAGALSNREAMRLQAHTRGSPLHTRTLVEELAPEALRDKELPLPAPHSFAMLVLNRLARCSPDTERLVVAVAVLGRRAPIELAARLADVKQPLVFLEEAIAAHLLEEQRTATERLIGFPHPLVQAAVYRDIGPARRSLLHHRAAELVRDEADILSHRVAATAGTDTRLAEEVATSARRQTASGAWTIAANQLVTAARLSSSQSVRERHLLEAVEWLLIDGSTTEAVALEGTVAAFRAAAHQRYVLGRLALVSGAIARAETFLADAWQRCDQGAESALAAQIAGQLATVQQLRGNAPPSLEWARRALATHPATARAEHMTDLLLLALGMSGRCSEGLRMCASLPEGGKQLHAEPLDGLVGRGVLRLWSGDAASARYDLDAVANAHERFGNCPIRYRIIALAALADAEYRLGAWDAALVHAELAVATAEDAEQHWLLALPHAVASFMMAGRGDWKRAQAHSAAATREALAAGDIIGIGYAATARALLSTALNDPVGVVTAVEPVLRLDAGSDISAPGILPLRELYLDALIELGQFDEAKPLVAHFKVLADQQGDPALLTVAHRLRGKLEATGHPDEAEAAYQDGLRHAQNLESPLRRAQLEVAYGRFLRHTGRRAAAATQLRAASHRLSQLGALPYLERCSRELEACGIGQVRRQTAGNRQLTSQERAVAQLVAAGRSNRQAAKELFLSVKTIEFHLTNVFTKLGVRSRSQLVLALPNTRDDS